MMGASCLFDAERCRPQPWCRPCYIASYSPLGTLSGMLASIRATKWHDWRPATASLSDQYAGNYTAYTGVKVLYDCRCALLAGRLGLIDLS